MANETDELATLRARVDAAEKDSDEWQESSRDWKYRAEKAEKAADALRAENARLREALEAIRSGYERTDYTHKEFRVAVFHIADAALAQTEAENGPRT